MLADHHIASLSTQVQVTADAKGRGHIESTATLEDGSQIMSEDVYFAGTGTPPTFEDLLVDGSGEAVLATTGDAPGAMASIDDTAVVDFTLSNELLRSIAEQVAAQTATI